MSTKPSFQWYPSDWMNDLKLRSVSVAARGLWVDMLCIMHQGEPYGHMKVNHKVIPKVNLAHASRLTIEVVDELLRELQEYGVLSIDDDGAYFSRRMVRDEEIRQARAAGGVKGGNPNLRLTLKVNPDFGSEGYPYAEDEEKRISSSIVIDEEKRISSSITIEEEGGVGGNGDGRGNKTTDADSEQVKLAIQQLYAAYPRKVGKQAALKAIRAALARITREDAANWMLGRVQKFAASPAGQAGEYTPHPSTWFNQGRYDDDDSEWSKHGQGADAGRLGVERSPARVRAEPGKYDEIMRRAREQDPPALGDQPSAVPAACAAGKGSDPF